MNNSINQKTCMFETIKDLQKYLSVAQTEEKILFECPLFQIKGDNPSPAKASIKFFRFYESFMLISKSKSFAHFKYAAYGPQIVVNIKYHLRKNEENSIKSLEFITKEGKNKEFFTPNQLDLQKVREIVKNKFNLIGFHEYFKAVKKIGRGNFAIVYMAYNTIDKEQYAVKSMSKAHILKQHNGLLSFYNEISILRAISHPNLIKLDSVYETDNSYYIVLELFSGGNLKEYLKDYGLLSEEKAAFIAKSVLKALEYLQENSIIHRDIKPDNILFRSSGMFSSENQIALADLGLATFKNVTEYLFPRCGTPGFVAPEVANYKPNEEKYDEKCDLYSLGVTLYYALTGKLPYPGKREILKENRECCIDLTKSELFRTLSTEVKDLLSKLLCPKEKRLNVYEAMNHAFFKKYCKSNEDQSNLEEGEYTSRQIHTPFLNIQNLNNRKNLTNDKNSFALLPVCSPIRKNTNSVIKEIKESNLNVNINDNSLSFVTQTPLLTGFCKTVKSLVIKNDQDQENLSSKEYLDNENINMPTALTTSIMSHEFKLLNKLNAIYY